MPTFGKLLFIFTVICTFIGAYLTDQLAQISLFLVFVISFLFYLKILEKREIQIAEAKETEPDTTDPYKFKKSFNDGDWNLEAIEKAISEERDPSKRHQLKSILGMVRKLTIN